MTIPGFLGIPDSPRIIPGCKPQGYLQSKYTSQDSWEYQTIPGLSMGCKPQGYPQSKYPRIPGNTRQSRDYPGMQATGLPQVQVSQDSWEYQTIPGLSRDASHRATPSPSIPGFLGIPDNPGIIPGCKPQGYPKSKYPRIPGNTRQSRDYPGMQATGLHPVQVSQDSWEYQTVPGLSRDANQKAIPPVQLSQDSKYPGIPGNSGQSRDHPRMRGMLLPPCPSILGFPRIVDSPGIIPV